MGFYCQKTTFTLYKTLLIKLVTPLLNTGFASVVSPLHSKILQRVTENLQSAQLIRRKQNFRLTVAFPRALRASFIGSGYYLKPFQSLQIDFT